MFDTHCHLQFKAYDADREEVIERNLSRGLIMNLVGTQRDTSKWGVELAEKHDNLYATIGTHPIHLFPTHVDEEETHFMSREEDFDEAYYETLAQSKKVIAVGETGLDAWHIPDDMDKDVVLKKQRDVFLKHVRFAKKHALPLVIHCRNAHDEMVSLLREEQEVQGGAVSGVVHCFTGNWQHAQAYLSLGFYLGLTGVITFPAKKTDPTPQEELLEVVRKAPLDRLLVETDAPYLAPQAYRGKRSEPFMIEEQIKFIAAERGISALEVQEAVTRNALSLFTRVNA